MRVIREDTLAPGAGAIGFPAPLASSNLRGAEDVARRNAMQTYRMLIDGEWVDGAVAARPSTS